MFYKTSLIVSVLIAVTIKNSSGCIDDMEKAQGMGMEIGIYFLEQCCQAGAKCGNSKDIPVIHEMIVPYVLSKKFLGFAVPTLPFNPYNSIKEVQKDCHPAGTSRDYCKEPGRKQVMPCVNDKWRPILVGQYMPMLMPHCMDVAELIEKFQPARMTGVKHMIKAYCTWCKTGRPGKLPKFDVKKELAKIPG